MAYKIATNSTKPIITKMRSFLILNKFLNGVKITRIKPAKLLMKKRGYRETLFQKSFIKNSSHSFSYFNYIYIILKFLIKFYF